MRTMDYSRIEQAVDTTRLRQSNIVIVGAGGSYSLVCALARMGVGYLTVLDFDKVEASNLVRQGYEQEDIGEFKVTALGKAIKRINPDITYRGITKNFLEMTSYELGAIFQNADLFMFLTDSFNAQAFGNVLALRYKKPALWAGWYTKSRTCELFFQIPKVTPACFRCAASSRYVANEHEEIKISSNCNTIFHSQLLDALIGFVTMGILHCAKHFKPLLINGIPSGHESNSFFEDVQNDNETIDHNFFQFKVHPKGGNSLFDTAFNSLGKNTPLFMSYWQKVEPELKSAGYSYDCPDCKGKLYELYQS